MPLFLALGDHLHQNQVRLKAVPINNVDRSVGGILSFEVGVGGVQSHEKRKGKQT